MRISDWSSDVCSSDLSGKDRTADMFSTHPRGPDRVKAAIEEARAYPQDPIYRRDEYLDRIDGMLYGDDPKEGVVRGHTFTHPDLRLSFSVPEDWRIPHTPSAVVASHQLGWEERRAGKGSVQQGRARW